MSPPFLPAPFGALICLRPAAVRLPLVTVPEGQQLYSWFWNVATLSRCFTRSASAHLPLSFRSRTLRTLVIVSERSHFSTSLRLQQLRCVLIAPQKALRKALLLCLFVRVIVFTNCNVFKQLNDCIVLS